MSRLLQLLTPRFCLALAAPCYATVAGAATLNGRVFGVADGDTITVIIPFCLPFSDSAETLSGIVNGVLGSQAGATMGMGTGQPR